MNRPQLAVLNHLLAQQEGVRQRLAEHAGRRFRVELPPLGVSAVVLADGFAGQTDGEPEARVRLSSSLLVKRLTGGEPGAGDVQLDGDAELGLALARILADLRWDAVEDLSRVVGDVAAYRAERWLRGALGVKGEVAWRLASAYAEHLKEETPCCASARRWTPGMARWTPCATTWRAPTNGWRDWKPCWPRACRRRRPSKRRVTSSWRGVSCRCAPSSAWCVNPARCLAPSVANTTQRSVSSEVRADTARQHHNAALGFVSDAQCVGGVTAAPPYRASGRAAPAQPRRPYAGLSL
ncbi:MAG: hypothetical protein U1E47_04470 [Rivihabitans pingtungensis]